MSMWKKLGFGTAPVFGLATMDGEKTAYTMMVFPLSLAQRLRLLVAGKAQVTVSVLMDGECVPKLRTGALAALPPGWREETTPT